MFLLYTCWGKDFSIQPIKRCMVQYVVGSLSSLDVGFDRRALLGTLSLPPLGSPGAVTDAVLRFRGAFLGTGFSPSPPPISTSEGSGFASSPFFLITLLPRFTAFGFPNHCTLLAKVGGCITCVNFIQSCSKWRVRGDSPILVVARLCLAILSTNRI